MSEELQIEKKNSRLRIVLRWICVIPGGLVFSLLASFPLHWILYGTLVKGSMVQMPLEDMHSIERFLYPILASIVFVYAGSKIAPKKQFPLSIILFILSIVSRVAAIAYVASVPEIEMDTSFYGLSRLGLSALAGGIGVLLIYIEVNQEEIAQQDCVLTREST